MTSEERFTVGETLLLLAVAWPALAATSPSVGMPSSKVNNIILLSWPRAEAPEIPVCSSKGNHADTDGGAFLLFESQMELMPQATARFDGNVAHRAGGALAMTSGVYASLLGSLSLNSNQALYGGALALSRSLMNLTGTMSLTTNFAVDGGAIFAQLQARVIVGPGSVLSIEDNTAAVSGGGVACYNTDWILEGNTLFAGENGEEIRCSRVSALEAAKANGGRIVLGHARRNNKNPISQSERWDWGMESGWTPLDGCEGWRVLHGILCSLFPLQATGSKSRWASVAGSPSGGRNL